MKLLNINNAKTPKGQSKGYLTGILYLAPGDESNYEVCPMRSPGCFGCCLYRAGYGQAKKTQRARIAKTQAFFEDRKSFMYELGRDIHSLRRKAARENLTPIVRLNGTSDIPWHHTPFNPVDNIMAAFPDIDFYDYTKVYKRLFETPPNYHLTFSLTEDNLPEALRAISLGFNVAAAFKDPLPSSDIQLISHDVIDGDEDDLRHATSGKWIYLHAKGILARNDDTGFVMNSLEDLAHRIRNTPESAWVPSFPKA